MGCGLANTTHDDNGSWTDVPRQRTRSPGFQELTRDGGDHRRRPITVNDGDGSRMNEYIVERDPLHLRAKVNLVL